MELTQILGGTEPGGIRCTGAVEKNMDMILEIFNGSGFDRVLLLVVRLGKFILDV